MKKTDIPNCCPRCGRTAEWNEVVNPFTTGIPILGGKIRFSLLITRGFRFRRVSYRCDHCKYENQYILP